MFGVFRKVFSILVATVMLALCGSQTSENHTVLDEEDCRLCVSVLADAHIEGNNIPRFTSFVNMLRDAKKNTFGNDAAVFLGDNTMNGQTIESLLFYGAVAVNRPSDNIISVCGNHDVGNGEGDYDSLLDKFLNYNNDVLGTDIEKPYYYKVINGYYFIVLAPEDLCVYELPISDEQLSFLDETLALATKDGKPAFVCAHHPWDCAEKLNPATGEYEYAEDEMLAILTKYDNVFYISGHTHMCCYEGWTFNSDYGVNEINLPRCTELAGADDNEIYDGTGWGVQLEVYDDEVVGRVRNYYTGTWDDSLEYHFDLT